MSEVVSEPPPAVPLPDALLLREVRCFRGSHRARLRPLTLLVGENSTGKTTLLGCYAALHGLLADRTASHRADFQQEPFSMGSFRDLVRSRRGREGALREFAVGFRVPEQGDEAPAYEVVATFTERGAAPAPVSVRYEFGSRGFLEFRRVADDRTTVAIEGHTAEVDFPFDLPGLVFLVSPFHLRGSMVPGLAPVREFVGTLDRTEGVPGRRAGGFLLPALGPLVPVAPLRTRPRRTYDPARETATAEGAEVPMLLRRLDHSDGERWKSLRGDLVAFGEASGLFSDIRVKRHGRQISDPFQLQVRAHSGYRANLKDVGYGVSQSLPILVGLLGPAWDRAPTRRADDRHSPVFLLQQPEAHLHPRGQAELASLFVESARERGHRFLIETHSDHLVDRIRISVRQRKIAADQVSILYFEPQKNAVSIHDIRLDEYGNLDNAPPGYRDFFLRETDTLLGLER